MIALVLIAWLGIALGFILGAAWATRKPEPPPPTPKVRIVQAVMWRELRQHGTLVPIRDVVPHREDFDPSARAVIDELMERHKW